MCNNIQDTSLGTMEVHMENKVETTPGEIKDHLHVYAQRSSGGVQETGNCDHIWKVEQAGQWTRTGTNADLLSMAPYFIPWKCYTTRR